MGFIRVVGKVTALLVAFSFPLLVQGREIPGSGGVDVPEWSEVEQKVSARLTEPGMTVARLAEEVAAAKAKTPAEALVKYNVFIRARKYKEAAGALQELKAVCPGLSEHWIADIYRVAKQAQPSYQLPRLVLETFADNLHDFSIPEHLLNQLLASGWSFDRVDQWLLSYAKGNPCGSWATARLFFTIKHDRGAPLLREIAGRIKEDPTRSEEDIQLLFSGVSMWNNYGKGEKKKWDLSWMPDEVITTDSLKSGEIAGRLERLGYLNEAIAFYQRQVDTPLTDQEVRKRVSTNQFPIGPDEVRGRYIFSASETIAECYLKWGRTDEARKWAEKADRIREKLKYPPNTVLVEALKPADGQQPLGHWFLGLEATSGGDPRYWRSRSFYHRALGDLNGEEDALKRGLALAKPLPLAETNRMRAEEEWPRGKFLENYAKFLGRQNRTGEAIALLRKEMEEAPLDTVSPYTAAEVFFSEFGDSLRPDDEIAWKWFERSPKWRRVEADWLEKSWANLGSDDRETAIARADRLAMGECPDRARTLSEVLVRLYHKQSSPSMESANRKDLLKHAIKNLEYAAAKMSVESSRDSAASDLFGLYIEAGDWKSAEGLFPWVSQKEGAPARAYRWRVLAVTAARAGDGKDAMRFWANAAEVAPADTYELDDLVRAGLKTELVKFYRTMQSKLPSSSIPARALERLKAE